MYKKFDIEYNKEILLEIYKLNKSGPLISKGPFNQLDINLENNPEVVKLFNYFTCISPAINGYCGISELNYSTVPHVSPKNNGLIIFPLRGTILTKFFSYNPESVNGRPELIRELPSLKARSDLYNSFIEEVVIDKPTAINGLVVHQYTPVDNVAVFFCLKIPLYVDWNTVDKF